MEKLEYYNLTNDVKYDNQIGMTSQFRFCGNCFRIDTYRGCDHGCKYCFANNRMASGFGGVNNMQLGDHTKIENKFKAAFEAKKETVDLSVELLRARVPLHLGGMSDPFQQREGLRGLTLKFLRLSKMFKYPVVISTKAAGMPSDEYWDVLDPELHTFQVSLIGTNATLVKNFETSSPPPAARISFIKDLKKRGFWVSVRIQPLIDLGEADAVLKAVGKYIYYCTVEHLKLPKFNDKIWSSVLEHLSNDYKALLRASPNKPEFELNSRIKLDNILFLKSKYKDVKFGCGDNDLHQYSDSLNCCGVDLMPPAFSNWLKYNSMYIKMTGDRSQWIPKCSINGLFLDKDLKYIKKWGYKEFVDNYYNTIYEDDRQLSLFASPNDEVSKHIAPLGASKTKRNADK
jgi:DNA repair photolyase